uniref:Uncharacterized protein n=1 Tax=Rousettus aegyptiacus TaxID=9407 RepID=A0A7J8FIL7_ROUAE|nr:hypothetical protein HJG63_011916 [Rousettus aegyptiacus]
MEQEELKRPREHSGEYSWWDFLLESRPIRPWKRGVQGLRVTPPYLLQVLGGLWCQRGLWLSSVGGCWGRSLGCRPEKKLVSGRQLLSPVGLKLAGANPSPAGQTGWKAVSWGSSSWGVGGGRGLHMADDVSVLLSVFLSGPQNLSHIL